MTDTNYDELIKEKALLVPGSGGVPSSPLDAGTGGPVPASAPTWSNGANQDFARNLQAGQPRFSLSVGDPRYTAVYDSATYFARNVFEVAPAMNNNDVRIRLTNPAGSTKFAVQTYLCLQSNTARFVTLRYFNPALANLTSVSVPVSKNANSLSTTSAIPVCSATYELDDPTIPSANFILFKQRLQAGVPFIYAEPVGLEAGTTLDLGFDDGTLNVTTDRFTLNQEWYEE